MKAQWFYYSPDPDDSGSDASSGDDSSSDTSGNTSENTDTSSDSESSDTPADTGNTSSDSGTSDTSSDAGDTSSDSGSSDTSSDTSDTSGDGGSSDTSSDSGDSGSPADSDTSSSSGDSGSGDGSSDSQGDSSSTTGDASSDSGDSSSSTGDSGDSTDTPQPGSGGSTASADFDTDMQTIRDYVRAIVETKTKIATAYLSAIDNFQTTVQSASPKEAKPDILGVVLKAGMKFIEKQTVSAVKDATGADLGPIVDLVHAIYDEVDKAAKSAQSLAAGEWIKTARTSITNAYTQDQTGEALRNQIEGEYKNNDEGARGGYIGGIQNELQATNTVQAPKEEIIEVAFYTAWINQFFNSDCIDGTGIIYLQFEDDGTPGSATVTAPMGDKVAGALNNQMVAAGVSQLMDLDVVKKVCKGDSCMCFEGNNVVRKAASNDADQAFLSSPDNWKKLSRFS